MVFTVFLVALLCAVFYGLLHYSHQLRKKDKLTKNNPIFNHNYQAKSQDELQGFRIDFIFKNKRYHKSLLLFYWGILIILMGVMIKIILDNHNPTISGMMADLVRVLVPVILVVGFLRNTQKQLNYLKNSPLPKYMDISKNGIDYFDGLNHMYFSWLDIDDIYYLKDKEVNWNANNYFIIKLNNQDELKIDILQLTSSAFVLDGLLNFYYLMAKNKPYPRIM
ncbi:MAG: hypothetical protein Q3971_01135 [Moraxella sp.]|nr:hypothetical protein [Moraxella sp.]